MMTKIKSMGSENRYSPYESSEYSYHSRCIDSEYDRPGLFDVLLSCSDFGRGKYKDYCYRDDSRDSNSTSYDHGHRYRVHSSRGQREYKNDSSSFSNAKFNKSESNKNSSRKDQSKAQGQTSKTSNDDYRDDENYSARSKTINSNNDNGYNSNQANVAYSSGTSQTFSYLNAQEINQNHGHLTFNSNGLLDRSFSEKMTYDPYNQNINHFDNNPSYHCSTFPQGSNQFARHASQPAMMENYHYSLSSILTKPEYETYFNQETGTIQQQRYHAFKNQTMPSPYISEAKIDQQKHIDQFSTVPMVIEHHEDIMDDVSAITMKKLPPGRMIPTNKNKRSTKPMDRVSDGKMSSRSNMWQVDGCKEVCIPPGDISIILSSTPQGLMIEEISNKSVAKNLLHVGDKMIALDGVDISTFPAKVIVQLLHKRKDYDERRITYIPAHVNLKEETKETRAIVHSEI